MIDRIYARITGAARAPVRSFNKLPVYTRLYLIGAGILLAGLLAAASIVLTAPANNDDPSAFGDADASVDMMMPAESKKYRGEIEHIGGQAGLLGVDLEDWFDGLWHGKQLGYTVGCLSGAAALLCFLFARMLSVQAALRASRQAQERHAETDS